jgi:riboflavin synthase
MFTGIIEEVGTIAEVSRGRGLRLAVRVHRVLEGLKSGDSIAVAGPCLTVESVSGDRFHASLLPETAEATTLSAAQVGRRVNLERALRFGDRLGGHLVTGHVDGVGEVTSVQDRGDTRLVDLLCPADQERYLVDKGSVAIDGVSLTVRAPVGRHFSVALVHATLAATTLNDLRLGDRVNIELDLIAKHIARLLGESSPAEGKLAAWLAEADLQ